MDDTLFAALERAAREGHEKDVLEVLVEGLRERKEWPLLFQALLMRGRHELDLPLLENRSIQEFSESIRPALREKFEEICRQLGSHHLAADDLPGAWSYFHAIGETETIAAALEAWSPRGRREEELEAAIEIAFRQGAHPVRGYELILAGRGTCEGITVLEGKFPYGSEVREECSRRLIRQFYGEMATALQRAFKRGEGRETDETDVRVLIEGRPWLFENRRCHVDDSHLQSVLRIAATLSSPAEIGLAVRMSEYGCRLAKQLQVSEAPPFDDFYPDYGILLSALAGRDVEAAVEHFRGKLERLQGTRVGSGFAAHVLAYLLHRIGRADEALDVYLQHPQGDSKRSRVCPPLHILAENTGRYDPLLESARQQGDPLQFAAGLVGRCRRAAQTDGSGTAEHGP